MGGQEALWGTMRTRGIRETTGAYGRVGGPRGLQETGGLRGTRGTMETRGDYGGLWGTIGDHGVLQVLWGTMRDLEQDASVRSSGTIPGPAH